MLVCRAPLQQFAVSYCYTQVSEIYGKGKLNRDVPKPKYRTIYSYVVVLVSGPLCTTHPRHWYGVQADESILASPGSILETLACCRIWL